MSEAAQALQRFRCHSVDADVYCEFCRTLAAIIIAGDY